MEGYGTSAVIYLKVRTALPPHTDSVKSYLESQVIVNSVGKPTKKQPGSESHSCTRLSDKDPDYFCCVSQALSSESVERLPVFNKSALRHYQASTEADDWCMPSKDPKKLGKYERTR